MVVELLVLVLTCNAGKCARKRACKAAQASEGDGNTDSNAGEDDRIAFFFSSDIAILAFYLKSEHSLFNKLSNFITSCFPNGNF